MFPKFAFALRATNTSNHRGILEEYDRAVRDALEGILGCPLTPAQWKQASLPTAMGGLGLRSASDHSAAAYLASVTAAGMLVQEIQQAGQAQGREIDQQFEVEDNVDHLQPPASVVLPLADLNAQLGDHLNYGEVTAHTAEPLCHGRH